MGCGACRCVRGGARRDPKTTTAGREAEFFVECGVCLPADVGDDAYFEGGERSIDRGPDIRWGHEAPGGEVALKFRENPPAEGPEEDIACAMFPGLVGEALDRLNDLLSEVCA